MLDEERGALGLEATLAGVADRTLEFEQRPGETIVPPRPAPGSGERRLLSSFTQLGAQPRSSVGSALELGPTIGQGGMGVVRVAQQLTLGRKVAVKTLRDPGGGQEATLGLLREAWATGALEHPNIVPVHDIGWSEAELPLIVLKHIEGVHWGELMHDEEGVRSRFARPLLDWNLGVLIQVCQAISFAHSRGILHRDLKPENIMLGAFGEVYVLDWGIAVARDDSPARELLPRVSEATELAGTPSYMAPEMLGGAPSRISERTDVYLLGAILYELLTGGPPHRGERLADLIESIIRASPVVPEDAPAELAAICARALAADPEARFSSVHELRLAIEAFLEHRGSHRLAQAATDRLEQLLAALGGAGEQSESSRQTIYNLLGACRFGFQQALQAWSDNVEAREGLDRAIEAVVRYELRCGAQPAAELLFAELEQPSADLVRAIEGGRRAWEQERARLDQLERLGRELDPSIGRRTRLFLSGLVGSIWTLVPLAKMAFPEETLAPGRLAIMVVAMVGLILAAGLWARDSMMKTAVNRRIFAAALAAMLLQLLLMAGGQLLRLELRVTQVLFLSLWSTMSVMFTILFDRRWYPSAIAYPIAFLLAAWRPDWVYPAISATSLVLTANLMVMWGRSPRRG